MSPSPYAIVSISQEIGWKNARETTYFVSSGTSKTLIQSLHLLTYVLKWHAAKILQDWATKRNDDRKTRHHTLIFFYFHWRIAPRLRTIVYYLFCYGQRRTPKPRPVAHPSHIYIVRSERFATFGERAEPRELWPKITTRPRFLYSAPISYQV